VDVKINTHRLFPIGTTDKLETFVIRFKEQISLFNININNSKLAQNVLDNGHDFVPMENKMKVLHITKNI
jgi:hypothetical protein